MNKPRATTAVDPPEYRLHYRSPGEQWSRLSSLKPTGASADARDTRVFQGPTLTTMAAVHVATMATDRIKLRWGDEGGGGEPSFLTAIS